MATSKIPMSNKLYDLTSMNDIVALLTKLSVSEVVPIHCGGDLGTVLTGTNVQLQGQACNINGTFIDMFVLAVSLSYGYMFRVQADGTFMFKRRWSIQSFT